MRVISLSLLLVVIVGCAQEPINPSFPVSRKQAQQELHRISSAPRKLDRPLVIIGGFADPGLGPAVVKAKLQPLIDDDRIVTVTVMFGSDFDECRAMVIKAVEAVWPSDEEGSTVEVDVIGLSMGGVVGRYAAAALPGHKRLRVARLFTISSPLAGAQRAGVPSLDQKVIDMRPGSEFLRSLSAEPLDAELICYTRLNDKTVGETLAAPSGQIAWWVSTPPLSLSHSGAAMDPRIIADIVRRLRGETPFTREPAVPPPGAQST